MPVPAQAFERPPEILDTLPGAGGGQLAPFSPDEQFFADMHQNEGNAFVNQFLDSAEPEAPVLSPAEAAAARSYHTLQPQKYTKAVVTDMQNALGVGATGMVDDATVQAIARFQKRINAERAPSPPLAVDGKCGPRTLPILIPVGLAKDDQIDAYVAEVDTMQPELDQATLDERAMQLIGAVNSRLTAAGVPACGASVDREDPVNRFRSDTWVINMSVNTLSNSRDAAEIVYHEARHAEQTFRAARMLAGRKMTAVQIAAEAGIGVPAIVEAAMAQPLSPGTVEAVQAEGWHEHEIGQRGDAEVKEEMSVATVAMVEAMQSYIDDPTPAREAKARAAYKRQAAAHLAYRNVPHEYDAFFVGEKVGDKLGNPRAEMPTFEEMLEKVKALPR